MQTTYVQGPKKHFTTAQVKLLRDAIRELHAKYDAEAERKGERWSQQNLGDLLHVTQQVAGRYLGGGDQGVGYPVALRVAKLHNFDTIEDFFAFRGVGDGPARAAAGHRDLAIAIARKVGGISEIAIERVLTRYDESQYDSRPSKWWLMKFLAEDQDLASEATPPASSRVDSPTAAAPSVSMTVPSKHKKRARKTA